MKLSSIQIQINCLQHQRTREQKITLQDVSVDTFTVKEAGKVVRGQFHFDLDTLQDKIMELGELAKEALNTAMNGLRSKKY
ncbi:hypothetical protein GCM10020331_039470 [Ectobacillus funiculus]